VPLGFRSAGPPQVPAIRARPEVELSADALGRCRWPNGRQGLCYTVALPPRFAATNRADFSQQRFTVRARPFLEMRQVAAIRALRAVARAASA
jgi:hypothetical protein